MNTLEAVKGEHRALRRFIKRLYENASAWQKSGNSAYRYAVDDVADWLERRRRKLRRRTK